MNNRCFIAMHIANEAVLDDLRIKVEGERIFDRYGDASLAYKYSHFGFSSVVPVSRGGKVRWLWRMLLCSYVFFPRGWHRDGMSRECFRWAEFLGKRVIFEEDGR